MVIKGGLAVQPIEFSLSQVCECCPQYKMVAVCDGQEATAYGKDEVEVYIAALALIRAKLKQGSPST